MPQILNQEITPPQKLVSLLSEHILENVYDNMKFR